MGNLGKKKIVTWSLLMLDKRRGATVEFGNLEKEGVPP
jgi:hypothetical protein